MNLQSIGNFCSNIIQWIFLTPTGRITMVFFILLWLGIILKISLIQHKNICELSGKKIHITDNVMIICKEIISIFGKLAHIVPLLLIIVSSFIAIASINYGINHVNQFITNQNRITELKTVIKHLEQNYKVAEIYIKDIEIKNSIPYTKLQITFFDYLGNKSKNIQIIDIKGSDIYLDCIVVNFDYTEIESNHKINLALPYRIYSDYVAQEQGYALLYKDEKGIPLMYLRDESTVYGIDVKTYNNHVKWLMDIIEKPEERKRFGIRNMYGSAPHKQVQKGDRLAVYIEQTGGLTLSRIFNF